MKKIKILALLMAILLCSSVLMVSCGDKYDPYSVADVMNADYEFEEVGAIGELSRTTMQGNFSGASKYNFVVTKIPATDNSGAVTYVYYVTADANEQLLKFNDTNAVSSDVYVTKHYVHVISEKYFAVMKAHYRPSNLDGTTSSYFGCPLDRDVEYSLSVYDAKGEVVDTFSDSQIKEACKDSMSSFDRVYFSGSDAFVMEYKDANGFSGVSSSIDLFYLDNEIYRYNSKYEVELVKNYGVDAMPNLKNMQMVGDYYLEIVDPDGEDIDLEIKGDDEDSEESEKPDNSDNIVEGLPGIVVPEPEEKTDARKYVYNVYNKDLDRIYDYTLPSYADADTAIGALLSNGKLLVQYLVQLDQYEKKFDIRSGADQKYDLLTLLIDAEKVKEVKKVDFVIGKIEASVADAEGNKVYADSVENLAFIYPIGKNKMIDKSLANQKLVLLSNEGKVTGEVKTEDKIVDFPKQYTKDSYSIELADGNYAIYDEDGSKINVLTPDKMDSARANGGYIYIKGDAIYDEDGEVVYDVVKNGASVSNCDDTFIIRKSSGDTSSYSRFTKEGQLDHIATTSKYDGVSRVSVGSGYYVVIYQRSVRKYNNGYNNDYTLTYEEYKYEYYNADGEYMYTSSNPLKVCVFADDYILMEDTKDSIIFKAEIDK